MSTAFATHHRLTNPFAAAAAVAVVVGGAAVIGVAVSQSSDTAPTTPSSPAQVNPGHPSRIGQGDFTQSQDGPSAPLKGGHTVDGLP